MPCETVWAVVTEPAYVKQWQYGSDLETDWTEGSPIRFRSEWQGQTFEQWGTVLAVDPPVELRYELFAPRPGLEESSESSFTMTYTLEADQEGTTLTITQEDPREHDVQAPQGEADPASESPVLVALKRLAESVGRPAR